jgi:VanZ family protein
VTRSDHTSLRLGPQDLAVRRMSLWLLGAWVALIASSSLYPFEGDPRRLFNAVMTGLPKLREWREPSQRDAMVNLLLYVPFGLLGSMALEKAGRFLTRILWPIIGAGLLSLAIEVVQHALPARDPSLADWALNIVSAAAGTLIAALYSALPLRPLSRRLQRLAIGPAPALLVALWLIAHLAPFVPRLRPGRIEAALQESLAMALSPGQLIAYFGCYLLLGALLNALLRRPYFWSALLLLFSVSAAARVLFVGQHLIPAEALGLALALPVIAVLRRFDPRRWESTVFILVCIALLASGTWPDPSATDPRTIDPNAVSTFVWLPFAELAGGIVDPGALPLLERLFFGIGLAWLALHGGTRRVPPLPLALLVAIVTEFLQQWVPGRQPDTTDIAALLIGAALAQGTARLDLRT